MQIIVGDIDIVLQTKEPRAFRGWEEAAFCDLRNIGLKSMVIDDFKTIGLHAAANPVNVSGY